MRGKRMGTRTKIMTGVGLAILLIIGIGTIYPGDAIPVVVYGVPDGAGIPIETPLPPYAYLSDGFLRVEISDQSPLYPGYGKGLSKDSVYTFNRIFTVENNESETGFPVICVLISSNSENIGFFESNFSGNWSSELRVEIQANQSVDVGMRFDTHGLELGDYETSIVITAQGGGCE